VIKRHQLAVLVRYHRLNCHSVSRMLVHYELESTSWLTDTNVMSDLLMYLEDQEIISVHVFVLVSARPTVIM
jgi:hypothetical protein